MVACKPIYNTFELKNLTPHEIVVEGFRTNTLSFEKADNIYMEPFSDLTIKRRDGEDFDSRTFFSIPYVDSVNILFNSDSVLTVTCFNYPDANCHPIVRGDVTVTITEEDYNNAVPIEE